MFDLMSLPAEVRIKIYEYALVRDVIRILPYQHYLEEPTPNKSDISTRSGFNVCNFPAGKAVGRPVLRSCDIRPDGFLLLVNIFLTSRKVYSEAWPIFYKKNTVSFAIRSKTQASVYACLLFLYERPYHALRHIRELRLLFGQGPEYDLRASLGSEPCQYLLRDISRYLSLRVLVLYIRGRLDDSPDHQRNERPWKVWLSQVTGLQELHMDIITSSTHEETIAFVKHMRSRMVVGGEQVGTEDFKLRQRPSISLGWTARLPCISLVTHPDVPDIEERRSHKFPYEFDTANGQLIDNSVQATTLGISRNALYSWFP